MRPAGLPLDMLTMRDPSLLVYFRPESGGLVVGGYERDPAPWGLDGIPADFNGKLLAEDWPRFEPLLENASLGTLWLAERPERALARPGAVWSEPVDGSQPLTAASPPQQAVR